MKDAAPAASARWGSVTCLGSSLAITILAVVLIVSSYPELSQTYDEGTHVTAGLEWLRQGRYTFQTENPPLARVAVALGPYFRLRQAGVAHDLRGASDVFYALGDYSGTLAAARAGTLPFFLLLLAVSWAIARRLSPAAGLMVVATLATLPPILAHAGMATTDIAFAAIFLSALALTWRWIEQPSDAKAALAGLGWGLAMATKFSTAAFAVAVVPAALFAARDRLRALSPKLLRAGAVALPVLLLTLWASYRFSIGTIDGLQNDLARLGHIDDYAVARALHKKPIPAPSFVHGLLYLHAHALHGHGTTVLGRGSRHGLWYFYPVVLLLKTPLPAILLIGIGLIALASFRREPEAAPFVALGLGAVAILLLLTQSTINLGTRHALVVYPMFVLAAVYGWSRLLTQFRAPAVIIALVGIAMQLGIVTAARANLLAYTNPLAGADPGAVISDSDLDWGQDFLRLVHFFQHDPTARTADQLHIAYFGRAKICDHGLPHLLALPPHPVTGWVAISETFYRGQGMESADLCNPDRPRNRPLKARDVAWLRGYQPVAYAGKSIRIYYIPPKGTEHGSNHPLDRSRITFVR